MTNSFDIRRHAVAAFAALLVSTACILGTIGPVDTGAPAAQAQYAESGASSSVRIA